MTRNSPAIAAAAMLAVALTFSHAPTATAGDDIGVLVEHIEIGEATATQLMLGHAPTSDASALRAEFEKHIAAGEAKVIDIAYSLGAAGKKAQAKSVQEYVFPTDWSEPQMPLEIEVPVTADMDIKLPASPIKYEGRLLGNTLTVTPELSEDGALELSIASRLTGLRGRRTVGPGQFGIEVPEFEERKISTTFAPEDRRPILAGVYTPSHKDQRHRRVFVFATAFLKKQRPQESDQHQDRGAISSSISFGVELVEVDQSQLRELLQEIPADHQQASTIGDKVAQLVGRGEAKILTSGSVTTDPNQRTRTEPVHEFIYPTRWDPPDIVKKLTPAVLNEGLPLKSKSVPNAFDTNNLGLVIEGEPQLTAGGRTIALQLLASQMKHAKNVIWGIEESASQQAVFGVTSVAAELSIQAGNEVLAAILTPREDKTADASADRRILVIVWADLAVARAPKENAPPAE